MDQGDSPSSILVPVSPTVRRLRSVLNELSSFVVSNGSDKERRMSKLLSVVVDEAMDEMGEMDERVLSSWMRYMACVIEWTATGNVDVLPDELVPFAAKVDGFEASEVLQDRYAVKEDEPESEIVQAELVPAEDARF